jgi:hypothetical protein
MANVHLAQVNIGRVKAPLDDPSMAGFVTRLDEINAMADAAEGFVWRLQGAEGNATYLRPFADDRILVNLSVWETVEHLRAYTYATKHAELLRQRHDWFEKFDGMSMTLWWIQAGHVPSVEEAKSRLEHLTAHGPTPFAFTFKRPFPAIIPAWRPTSS